MRVNKKKEFDFWESKAVLYALVFLIFLLLIFAINSFYKKYQIKKEIAILDSKIEKLKKENEEKKRQKDILTDSAFIEKEARIKLNFKKEGEEVVVLVDKPYKNDDKKNTNNTLKPKDKKKFNLFDEGKIKININKWIETIFN